MVREQEQGVYNMVADIHKTVKMTTLQMLQFFFFLSSDQFYFSKDMKKFQAFENCYKFVWNEYIWMSKQKI